MIISFYCYYKDCLHTGQAGTTLIALLRHRGWKIWPQYVRRARLKQNTNIIFTLISVKGMIFTSFARGKWDTRHQIVPVQTWEREGILLQCTPIFSICLDHLYGYLCTAINDVSKSQKLWWRDVQDFLNLLNWNLPSNRRKLWRMSLQLCICSEPDSTQSRWQPPSGRMSWSWWEQPCSPLPHTSRTTWFWSQLLTSYV